jgi:hypothetical protein
MSINGSRHPVAASTPSHLVVLVIEIVGLGKDCQRGLGEIPSGLGFMMAMMTHRKVGIWWCSRESGAANSPFLISTMKLYLYLLIVL